MLWRYLVFFTFMRNFESPNSPKVGYRASLSIFKWYQNIFIGLAIIIDDFLPNKGSRLLYFTVHWGEKNSDVSSWAYIKRWNRTAVRKGNWNRREITQTFWKKRKRRTEEAERGGREITFDLIHFVSSIRQNDYCVWGRKRRPRGAQSVDEINRDAEM
jgi:hypothetical protein